MKFLLFIYTFCLFHIFHTNFVDSISCYQCNSTDHENPFQCTEFLEDNIDLKPKECDAVYNAAFCIKHVGRFEGGLGTKRFCSSLDLGNFCNYIKQPGDDLEYRSCVYTCNTDGCNTAKHNHEFHYHLLLIALFVCTISFNLV